MPNQSKDKTTATDRLSSPPLSQGDLMTAFGDHVGDVRNIENCNYADFAGGWNAAIRALAELGALASPERGLEHQLYKTGDSDAPEQILDRNGEVALSLCRQCGKGEIELSEACGAVNPGGADAQWQSRLDSAYTQRNMLAIALVRAALAAGWNAGRGFDADTSKDWDDAWRHVLYVDLPDGRQVSWHMSPSEVPLLEGIPNYQGTWNGTFLAREPGWCQFHCADDCAPRDQDEAELIKAVLSAHRAGLRVKSARILGPDVDLNGDPIVDDKSVVTLSDEEIHNVWFPRR